MLERRGSNQRSAEDVGGAPRDASEVTHLTREKLEAGLPTIKSSPADAGPVRAIVVRPATDQRQSLQSVEISPDGGVHGDCWAQGCWLSLPDGRPHPDVQVAIMNARAIALIAQEEARWPLAGDNLFVDLDLSDGNLKPGQRLALGSAILEVTAVPHNACGKFAQRFGKAAARFVNSPAGKQLHLRGIYAKVVQAGTVSVDDVLTKCE